jgi:hypothetical protein
MSSSRVGGYGHSFAEKHQRTPETMPQGASGSSAGSWKTIDTLKSLPKDFPTSAVSQKSLDKPVGLLQRRIELESKGSSTKTLDQDYKSAMKDLYKETAHGQRHAPDEKDRNRLSNWSDKIIGTNKDSAFLPRPY